jgi:Flp pilus assembly protein protease CpaA
MYLKNNIKIMTPIEIFGYLSMVVVLISMIMGDIKKLRIVNSIACSMFVVYGFLLHAYPIVIMNVLVIAINLYKLSKGK